MKVQCDYCGQMIPETEQNCPYCEGANSKVKRTANGIPATIAELKAYCEAHHLPLDDMRVFIGENYQGAKAFGIYRDPATGNFVVYKNKADGSRAVRYEGNDEAYAVNELYMKIRERVGTQKAMRCRGRQAGGTKSDYGSGGSGGRRGSLWRILFSWAFLIFLLVGGFLAAEHMGPDRGYYTYENASYYYDTSTWYEWDDDFSRWCPTYVDSELKRNHQEYYESENWDTDSGIENFRDSEYYRESEEKWDNDWDNDWDDDWDDDWDWDDSYDDWDSDW